jgi:hypothetical protein
MIYSLDVHFPCRLADFGRWAGLTTRKVELRDRRSSFNHIQYLLLGMALCLSATSRLQSTERIDQGAVRRESQRQRYASAFQLVSKNVSALAGGTNSHTFAEDGQVSYLYHDPILVFPSFAHILTYPPPRIYTISHRYGSLLSSRTTVDGKAL